MKKLYEEFSEDAMKKGGVELNTYLFMLFNLYAEIYIQHKKYGLFDRDQMQVWENRIENDFLYRQFLCGYWKMEKQRSAKEFTDGFKHFIDSKLNTAEARVAVLLKEVELRAE